MQFYVVETVIKCECHRGALPFGTNSKCEIILGTYNMVEKQVILPSYSIGLGVLWFINLFEITLSHVFLKEESIVFDCGRFVLCRCIGGMDLFQKKRLRRWRRQAWKGGNKSEEIGPEAETGADYIPPWSPNAHTSHPKCRGGLFFLHMLCYIVNYVCFFSGISFLHQVFRAAISIKKGKPERSWNRFCSEST